MDSYEALAASYDELTEDVDYERRADFVERLFLRAKQFMKIQINTYQLNL